MKKTILIILLIILNFGIFYYLTKYGEVGVAYGEMVNILIASMIAIPFVSLIPACFIYILKLKLQRIFIPFKKIYLNFYFRCSVIFYTILLIVAITMLN